MKLQKKNLTVKTPAVKKSKIKKINCKIFKYNAKISNSIKTNEEKYDI